ncbi:MAG: phosphoadenosine phosphosulfate reductase family protein [Clostridiales Family XIII bacterium]|nr:phosphoadenosine phosphosulfate reductase family protein [Clostridiales Family XIII bacterium]
MKQKLLLTKSRIEEWYREHNGDVYVSVSGKDSTVLLDIVRSLYPEVPAVTVDTGLEHPENSRFLKKVNNIIRLKPEMSFKEVISSFGYPVISKMTARKLYTLQNPTKNNALTTNLYQTGMNSKGEYKSGSKLPNKWRYLVDNADNIKFSHKCCDIMKKHPLMQFERENKLKGYVGTMADEGIERRRSYLITGCNPYHGKGYSKPLSFWTNQDILQYIHETGIPISAAYGKVIQNEKGLYETTGEARTGCMFCLFGCHLEKEPNRIQRLEQTYPSLYAYCIRDDEEDRPGPGLGKVMDLIGVPYTCKEMRRREEGRL